MKFASVSVSRNRRAMFSCLAGLLSLLFGALALRRRGQGCGCLSGSARGFYHGLLRQHLRYARQGVLYGDGNSPRSQ